MSNSISKKKTTKSLDDSIIKAATEQLVNEIDAELPYPQTNTGRYRLWLSVAFGIALTVSGWIVNRPVQIELHEQAELRNVASVTIPAEPASPVTPTTASELPSPSPAARSEVVISEPLIVTTPAPAEIIPSRPEAQPKEETIIVSRPDLATVPTPNVDTRQEVVVSEAPGTAPAKQPANVRLQTKVATPTAAPAPAVIKPALPERIALPEWTFRVPVGYVERRPAWWWLTPFTSRLSDGYMAGPVLVDVTVSGGTAEITGSPEGAAEAKLPLPALALGTQLWLGFNSFSYEGDEPVYLLVDSGGNVAFPDSSDERGEYSVAFEVSQQEALKLALDRACADDALLERVVSDSEARVGMNTGYFSQTGVQVAPTFTGCDR